MTPQTKRNKRSLKLAVTMKAVTMKVKLYN